jgi:hypothetical protein
MRETRENWDSVSTDEKIDRYAKDISEEKKDAWVSFEKCKAACESDNNCKQYSFRPGHCGLSKASRLGHATEPKDKMKSGWLLDRIDAFREKNSGCAPIFITQ